MAAADEYKILTLEPADPDDFQPLEPEQLGSRPKFWFLLENDPQPWLFKYTRENTGEHWAEKVAAEIAPLITLRSAKVELARFQDKLGVISKSFVPHSLDPSTGVSSCGGDLIHGNEVLAGRVIGYDKEKTFRQSNHTWANIRQAIEARFTGEAAREQLVRFGGLLVFDALIGNVDRHHENWALLMVPKAAPDEPELTLAPSYDHASSLGRELLDQKRYELLSQGTVGRYAEQGHGGIYWQGGVRRAESPLQLVRLVAADSPEIVRPWLEALRTVDAAMMIRAIDRIPDVCMSETQREFSRSFLRYTRGELLRLLE